MGIGIGLKCPKCSFHKHYSLGSGFLLPVVHDEVVEKIKDGEYGIEWQEYFEAHPEAVVNVNLALYHCPLCNAIVDDYNLDLYNATNSTSAANGTRPSWGDGGEREFVKHYTHLCPICDGEMQEVDWIMQETLPCPRCGEKLIYRQDYNWD